MRSSPATRLRAAMERKTTGGVVAAYDEPVLAAVLRELADLAGATAHGQAGRDRYQLVRQTLEWWADAAVRAAVCGEGRVPTDLANLARDLTRIEYAQRTLDDVSAGRRIGEHGQDAINLCDEATAAAVCAVERWLNDSRDRRRADLTARVTAKEAELTKEKA